MGAEATTHADTYHRHGDPDPSKWSGAESVTGRPADVPPTNSTLADRAHKPVVEKVDEPATPAAKKVPARKAAAPKG